MSDEERDEALHEVRVPDLESTRGDSLPFKALVEVGALVERHDPIAEVESTKATLELTSEVTGIVVSVTPRNEVLNGDPVVTIREVRDPEELTRLRRERSQATSERKNASATTKAAAPAPRPAQLGELVPIALTGRVSRFERTIDLQRLEARAARLAGARDLDHGVAALVVLAVLRADAIAPLLAPETAARARLIQYADIRPGSVKWCHLSGSLDLELAQVFDVLRPGHADRLVDPRAGRVVSQVEERRIVIARFHSGGPERVHSSFFAATDLSITLGAPVSMPALENGALVERRTCMLAASQNKSWTPEGAATLSAVLGEQLGLVSA